ncbi:putative metal-nicotianamine transporter YSL9 [Apostasia shenzhenica]|uniref:Putative metal-nicotianamine transporter YSL9 n=1 Tax=Apostasia shenzhenica TaxID=1088818 RepID=A0A2I0A3W9_9ASPA|nr:putative metal-nicotianamine transporter YSL9 [Apostasia shenzhenica]
MAPGLQISSSTEAEERRDQMEEITKGDDLEGFVEAESSDPQRIPHWRKQLTVRGVFASAAVGLLYSVIVMKLNLTTGLVPTLNVSAALLTFVLLKAWTKLLPKVGVVPTPLTRQESTVAQTCAVAAYTIAYGGGFGSYLLGLNKKTYELAGVGVEGNGPGSYKEPGIGWMIEFCFVVSFVGILVLIPLRKILIIDYKLAYPSGTATAVLINGFHTSKGHQMAKKQVRGFLRYFTISFLWSFFQWFFSGGEACGFAQFPTFGLKAYENKFFFDFSLTYIGAGMICSHIVNISLILGAVLSWGVMWPLIGDLRGNWYPANISESSMKSLQGYKVFIAIALILGDGLYNFIKVMSITLLSMHSRYRLRKGRAGNSIPTDDSSNLIQQNELFARESIPSWLAYTSYAVFTVISTTAIPNMFSEVRWYYVIIAYVIAPILGFCNAYGTGLTDMNMAYNYGKVALFIIAALAGKDHGVVAGLVVCGMVKSVVYMSAELMHDFKTGHLTLTSPRSMLVSQLIGTVIGCVVGPLAFFLFYKAFDVGDPKGTFKAPYALVYRNMAILGVQGFSALPRHCLQLCYGFFGFAVSANILKNILPRRYGNWVPLPMATAVPFLVGANFAIDMFIGSAIVFVWHRINSKKAVLMIPAVASGLICGDGLWVFPSSLLALCKVKPPLCMMFVKSQ